VLGLARPTSSVHSPLSAKQGKPKPAACRPIPIGRRRVAGEGRVGVRARAEGKPVGGGGSDREAAHRSMAPDGDGGRRRGAPVRGRRSGGNPELKRCRCTLGWSGAHGGMDRAGRWPERPLSVSSWRNGGGGEWAMGARGSG
jgi:hypothetical protein